MKRTNWKSCWIVALSLSCSLPSSAVLAQTIVGPSPGGLMGGLGGIGSMFGGGDATRYEQVLQLVELKAQVDKLSQMLLNSPLGPQMQKAIEQMTGTHNEIVGVVETDSVFNGSEYDTLTPDQAIDLKNRRRAEKETLFAQLDQTRNEIATSNNKFDILGSGMALSMEPESDIQATQAVALNQVAQEKREWDQTALTLIDQKKAELNHIYELDEAKANEALNKCILESQCGS